MPRSSYTKVTREDVSGDLGLSVHIGAVHKEGQPISLGSVQCRDRKHTLGFDQFKQGVFNTITVNKVMCGTWAYSESKASAMRKKLHTRRTSRAATGWRST